MTSLYTLTGFGEGLAGIEALVTLDDAPITVIAGFAPYDVAPARSWAAHGAFLTWAEGEHGSVERAVAAEGPNLHPGVRLGLRATRMRGDSRPRQR